MKRLSSISKRIAKIERANRGSVDLRGTVIIYDSEEERLFKIAESRKNGTKFLLCLPNNHRDPSLDRLVGDDG